MPHISSLVIESTYSIENSSPPINDKPTPNCMLLPTPLLLEVAPLSHVPLPYGLTSAPFLHIHLHTKACDGWPMLSFSWQHAPKSFNYTFIYSYIILLIQQNVAYITTFISFFLSYQKGEPIWYHATPYWFGYEIKTSPINLSSLLFLYFLTTVDSGPIVALHKAINIQPFGAHCLAPFLHTVHYHCLLDFIRYCCRANFGSHFEGFVAIHFSHLKLAS